MDNLDRVYNVRKQKLEAFEIIYIDHWTTLVMIQSDLDSVHQIKSFSPSVKSSPMLKSFLLIQFFFSRKNV